MGRSPRVIAALRTEIPGHLTASTPQDGRLHPAHRPRLRPLLPPHLRPPGEGVWVRLPAEHPADPAGLHPGHDPRLLDHPQVGQPGGPKRRLKCEKKLYLQWNKTGKTPPFFLKKKKKKKKKKS